MSTEDFYKIAQHKFQQWMPEITSTVDLENIISPYKLSLPSEVLNKAKTLITAIYGLKKNSDYIQNILKNTAFKLQPHNSVLMAYDFHYSGERLKLIEVNTNASGYLLSQIAYQLQNINSQQSLQKLKDSFFEEYELFYKEKPNKPKVLIIDENPKTQKMYIEFLMYQYLFKSWGWSCDIKDFKDNIDKYQMIYNRYCDFDFSEKESQHLKTHYLKQSICITPHPVEYLLFAHKDRFITWTDENFDLDQNVKAMIPETKIVTSFKNKELLWEKRKTLFFKPRFMYGGKAVYNGKSISRKHFNKIADDDSFIAQETCPPGKVEFDNESWKYDLRFYVYKDQIQHVVARIYQGQLTNFNSKNGGFCPVIFE